MNELSPEARRLLALARHGDDPDERIRARVEEHLAARIALGGGSASATGSLAAAAKRTPRSFALKALVTLGAAGGLGGAAWFAVEGPPSDHVEAPARRAGTLASARAGTPGPSTMRAVVPETPSGVSAEPPPSRAQLEPDLATPSSEPPDTPKPRVTAAPTSAITQSNGERAAAGAPRAARAQATEGSAQPERAAADGEQPVESLQAETAALRSAQGALRGGDARRALELLAQQDGTFSHGALAEERAAARVLALCQAHEVNAARSAAQRFEERYPASALLGRVRSACRDR